MARPTTLVFDFDGTLVDSMGSLAGLASQVLGRYYAINAHKARGLYLATSGLAFQDQLEVLYPNHPSNRQASREFESAKDKNYLSEKICADAPYTLRELKKRGHRIAISSNNRQELVDRYLSKEALDCDLALGWREGFDKGLAHFLHIMDRWGLSPLDMVFIGDSIKDGERAFEAGIDFIGKEGTFGRKEFLAHFPGIRVVSCLAELINLIL